MVLAFGKSPLSGGGWSSVVSLPLPSTFTGYFNAGNWSTELDTGSTDPTTGFLNVDALLRGTSSYQAGRQYHERWNGGPFGPSFPTTPYIGQYITRQGDLLVVEPGLFGDGTGHEGQSVTATAQTTLYRNGVQLGQVPDVFGLFQLPPDNAQYRLEMQATRTGFAGLSSTVQTAWTFHSGHSTGDGVTPEPVMAVRFTPGLNADNQAPAGRFTFPVAVQHQVGSTSAAVRELAVQVSYDDGKTWCPVPLRGDRGGWLATVDNPAGTGFASLRATAVDSAGNSVVQTIIHAYQLSGH
jgi:hypothetical protein